jgi:hypothetical protein
MPKVPDGRRRVFKAFSLVLASPQDLGANGIAAIECIEVWAFGNIGIDCYRYLNMGAPVIVEGELRVKMPWPSPVPLEKSLFLQLRRVEYLSYLEEEWDERDRGFSSIGSGFSAENASPWGAERVFGGN